MDSFHTTCFASQQTIAPGDRCYLLPIRQVASPAYPGACWAPFAGFLKGQLQDNGAFTLLPSGFNQLSLAPLLSRLYRFGIRVPAGSDPSQEPGVDLPSFIDSEAPALSATLQNAKQAVVAALDPLYLGIELQPTWDYVWERGWRRRLQLAHSSGRHSPVAFAVLHPASFHYLRRLTEAHHSVDGEPFQQRVYFDAMLDHATGSDLHAATTLPLIATLFAFNNDLCKIGAANGLTCSAYPGAHDIVPPLLQAYGEHTLTREDLFHLVRPLLETRCVLAGLNQLNLKPSPLVVTKPDNPNQAGQDYLRFVTTVCAEVTEHRVRR